MSAAAGTDGPGSLADILHRAVKVSESASRHLAQKEQAAPYRASSKNRLKQSIGRSRWAGGTSTGFLAIPSLAPQGNIPEENEESMVTGNLRSALPLRSVQDIAEERVSLARILQTINTAPMFTLTHPSCRDLASHRGSRLHQSIERLRIHRETRQEEARTLMDVARARIAEEDIQAAVPTDIVEDLSSAARLSRVLPPPPSTDEVAPLPAFSSNPPGLVPHHGPQQRSLPPSSRRPLRPTEPKPSAETAGTAILSVAKKNLQRAQAA